MSTPSSPVLRFPAGASMKINSALIQQGTYHSKNQSASLVNTIELLNSKDLTGQQTIATSSDSQNYQSRLYAKTQSTISSGIDDQSITQQIIQQHELTKQVSSYTSNQVLIDTWRSPQTINNDEGSGIKDVSHSEMVKVYDSSERLIFESVGEVLTEDGRKIDFMMQLDFENSYHHESKGEVFQSARQWLDPLVISLTGQVPSIADGSFHFDLNSDGQNENLKQLGAGLAYIAFDKNGDGEINNGSELFGATSGQGFAELAQYDSDGNGWIDENDSIYHQLKVWQPALDTIQSSKQEGSLMSFREAEVGAIFLHATDTQYTFTDENNNAQARITQGSMALMESGKASYVFQMEWAMPLQVGNNISTFQSMNASTGVVATQARAIDRPGREMSIQRAVADSAPSNSFSQTPIKQTVFRAAQSTASFSAIRSTVKRPIPDNQHTLNPPVLSRPNKQHTNEPIVKLSEAMEGFAKEDKKIIELRAMIEFLKSTREGNFKQMILLQKRLIED